MTTILLIALGGAAGAVLRYLFSGWVQNQTSTTFPVGTLAVNLVGCLSIGLLGGALTGPLAIRESYRLGLMVGVIGGFTTFSTFGWETLALAGDRQFALALLNVLLSNGLGVVGVWFGLRMAEHWWGG